MKSVGDEISEKWGFKKKKTTISKAMEMAIRKKAQSFAKTSSKSDKAREYLHDRGIFK